MNAAQEYMRDMAARHATEALARAQTLNPAARVALLEEALKQATAALAAIGKLETMKREKAGD